MINRQTALFGIDDPNEKTFMSSVCDKAEKSIFSGRAVFSKFLSPREVNMVSERITQFVDVRFFGGYAQSERCVAAFCGTDGNAEEIAPDYMFPVQAVTIKTNNKTVYSHKDYLGALMSLGITRELLGDIVILENEAVLFCLSEICEFLKNNLTKVANTGVTVSEADIFNINIPGRKYEIINKTAASARLDCIVGACTNKSRSVSAQLVERGFVNVNYVPVKNTSHIVKDGDIISVRGFGKMLIEIGEGLSKKGKIKITVKQYI